MLKEIETKEEIQSGKVIIDFYSKTCATCKRMLRLFEQVVNNDSSINIVKIDTGSEIGAELAVKMNVSRLPTIKVLDNGVEKADFVGICNVNQIVEAYKQ